MPLTYVGGRDPDLIAVEQLEYLVWHNRSCQVPSCTDCLRLLKIRHELMSPWRVNRQGRGKQAHGK